GSGRLSLGRHRPPRLPRNPLRQPTPQPAARSIPRPDQPALVLRSSKAVDKLATQSTVWAAGPTPDPGFGTMVELARGEDGDLIDPLGIGNGLAGEGLPTEQAPPALIAPNLMPLLSVNRARSAALGPGSAGRGSVGGVGRTEPPFPMIADAAAIGN